MVLFLCYLKVWDMQSVNVQIFWDKSIHKDDRRTCEKDIIIYILDIIHTEKWIPIAYFCMNKQGDTVPSSKHLWSSNLSHWVMRALQVKSYISVTVFGNNNLSKSGSASSTFDIWLIFFLARLCAQLQGLMCPRLHVLSQVLHTFPRLVRHLYSSLFQLLILPVQVFFPVMTPEAVPGASPLYMSPVPI